MSADRSYQASFNENNQEFVIAGRLRPRSEDEIRPLAEALTNAMAQVRGTLAQGDIRHHIESLLHLPQTIEQAIKASGVMSRVMRN